jgi:hypothetical protein
MRRFVSQSCLNGAHFSKINGNLQLNALTFCVPLLECGYSQVPGMDIQKSFAPVINDVKNCIVMNVILTWNLKGKIVDIDNTFLHGTSKKQSTWRYPKKLRQMRMNLYFSNK